MRIGTEYLWNRYNDELAKSEEAVLSIIEDAAALKEMLQEEQGNSKNVIIAATVPGIWALGHLYVVFLRSWDKVYVQSEINQFLSDLEAMTQLELDPDVKAELLLLGSIVYVAKGDKIKSTEYANRYGKLCENNSGLADILAKMLRKEESKLLASTIKNDNNIAVLYNNTGFLVGLDTQADVIFQRKIKTRSAANGQNDRRDAVYKRLMIYGIDSAIAREE